MNNESDLWNCEAYQGSYEGTSNNTDPVFPQWGYYNTTFSPLCHLQCTSTSDLAGYCNITQSVGGCGAQVNDYYQNARGATAVAGFCRRHDLAGHHVAGRAMQGLPAVTVAASDPLVHAAERRCGPDQLSVRVICQRA